MGWGRGPTHDDVTAIAPQDDDGCRGLRCREVGHFVLLPGAWLEGRVFAPVVDGLRARGHQATAVTFPGLVDRAMGEPDLETWINAAADIVSDRATEHVVLVGHSFAGIVAGAVADRIPHLVGQLIYLDANLPVDGESFAESWTELGQQWLADQIAHEPDRRLPPDLDPVETQLNDAQQEILLRHAFAMPAAPLYQRSVLSLDADRKVATTYILCTGSRPDLPAAVADRLDRSDWTLRRLAGGHWPMVSHPDKLVALLDDIAADS